MLNTKNILCEHLQKLPVRSEGTKNFRLSISWMDDLGAFSTTTLKIVKDNIKCTLNSIITTAFAKAN